MRRSLFLIFIISLSLFSLQIIFNILFIKLTLVQSFLSVRITYVIMILVMSVLIVYLLYPWRLRRLTHKIRIDDEDVSITTTRILANPVVENFSKNAVQIIKNISYILQTHEYVKIREGEKLYIFHISLGESRLLLKELSKRGYSIDEISSERSLNHKILNLHFRLLVSFIFLVVIVVLVVWMV